MIGALAPDVATELRGVPASPGWGWGPARHAPTAPGEGDVAVPGVLVVPDLTPATVSSLEARAVTAVAAAAGAPLSHAAILARSLGIPFVCGLGPAILQVPAGSPLLVDGSAGQVTVHPSPWRAGTRAVLRSARHSG